MNIAILGAGVIGKVMANTVNGMNDVNLYAVASRDLSKAEQFAKEFGIKKAYGSYEEMLSDDNVDLVYVATPHSHHYEHMKLCIEKGKNVLCEKAFTQNKIQAEEIFALAAEKKVFVTEALWTRYMPSRKLIDETITSGIVGEIKTVCCNLSYDMDKKERILRPELAGGALLDLGIYGINFIVMHFGKDIESIESSVMMTETGVDAQESITIKYKDGKMGVTVHGIYGRSDRKGIFYGEQGYIIVENINNPQAIDVFSYEDKMIKHIDVPKQITGYEYEVMESLKMIKNGKLECPSIPHEDTLFLMDKMDEIRALWGMKYPGEA